MPPPTESPRRTLAAALAAMAGVALVVGLAVAAVILTVVNLSGVGEAGGVQEAAPETMFVPEYTPTHSPGGQGSGGSSESEPPSPTPTPTPTPSPSSRITLEISPREAAPGERLDLTGSYRDGTGASVTVQRKQGGSWIDFPVTATVRDDQFATYIMTSRTGVSVFRVFDKSAERSSNTVPVTIG